MFADTDVKTNLDTMKNDEVRTVNTKKSDKINVDKMMYKDEQDDRVDVAVESVKVIFEEEDNVTVDSDKEKSIEDSSVAAETTG